MLYISRCIGLDNFGVYDTEDNTESIVSHSEVVDVVSKLGVSIEGVHVYFSSLGLSAPRVSFVAPYQDERYVTPLKVKTKLMKHIDVTLWGTRVTAVTWKNEEITGNVSIRLSDFGDVCEAGILLSNSPSIYDRVTIILDDKIELRERCFIWGRTDLPGVHIDVREMRNELAVAEVYNSFVKNFGKSSTNKRLAKIIDIDSRKNTMKSRLSRC